MNTSGGFGFVGGWRGQRYCLTFPLLVDTKIKPNYSFKSSLVAI